MDTKSHPELAYDLPVEFYEVVKGYLSGNMKIQTEKDIVQLWSYALEFAVKYPKDREAIAEWTMSIGSYTPYVTGNDIFAAIHNGFGSLEVADSMQSSDADIEWKEQRRLFDTLLSKQSYLK